MPATPHLYLGQLKPHGLRLLIVGLLAGAGLLMGGCSTASSDRNLLMFAEAAPLPTIVAPGTELAAAEQAARQQHGCVALRGAGSSMEPIYLEGTAVVVRAGGYERLQPGQAAVYRNRAGVTVAHMLVRSTDYGWVAAGLNNATEDYDLVTADNLVGVITQAFASHTGPLPKAVAARIALREQVQRGQRVASMGL